MDVLLILIMVFQDGTHLIPVNIQKFKKAFLDSEFFYTITECVLK